MEAARYIETSPDKFSPDLGRDLSRLVSLIAGKLSGHRELKEEMLDKADELSLALNTFAKNPITLSQDAIDLTKSNLRWMEDYLDGKGRTFMLTSDQESRLRKTYLDIAQSLCMIGIQEAVRNNWATK